MNAVEQLKQAQLFKGINTTELEALVASMTAESIPAGKVLFHKGDPGDAMYVILSGTVRIFSRDTDGKEFTLDHYGPGHVLGDFSMVDAAPRSASATTEEPVEALVLCREDFLVFLPKNPTVGMAMIRHLTDRLRYITVYLNKVTELGQHLAEGDYDLVIQEMCDTEASHSEINKLMQAFTDMARNLKSREEKLTGQEN